MPEKPAPAKKLSDKNTKQEMLDAYHSLLKDVEDRRAAELNPEKRIEEKRVEEAVGVAQAISAEAVDRGIAALKADIGRVLADLSDKLAAEAGKYRQLQKAIDSKQKELQELYGIEKSTGSLAALIEAQNQKRREFDEEITQQRTELEQEIGQNRADWDKERKQHEAELKERDAAEKKARDREKEELGYLFKREQQSIKDQLQDQKATLEKEIKQKRETSEKELAEREKTLAEKEKELAGLQQRVAAFPKELETAVTKAVQEATQRLKLEASTKEELLRKEYEGQKNVFTTRVEALENKVKELADLNAKLSAQAQNAYQKVQDIAEKAIEGSSQAKTLADLQKMIVEQNRKGAAEKG